MGPADWVAPKEAILERLLASHLLNCGTISTFTLEN